LKDEGNWYQRLKPVDPFFRFLSLEDLNSLLNCRFNFRWVFSAGLSHVRCAAAATACDFGDFFDDVAGVGAKSNGTRCSHDDEECLVAARRAKDDYGVLKLVFEAVANVFEHVAVRAIDFSGDDVHALDIFGACNERINRTRCQFVFEFLELSLESLVLFHKVLSLFDEVVLRGLQDFRGLFDLILKFFVEGVETSAGDGFDSADAGCDAAL